LEDLPEKDQLLIGFPKEETRQKIPLLGWTGGWTKKLRQEAQALQDATWLLILLRKSMVAGAGFEPVTFGL